MHTFLHRYELDESAPTGREALRDIGVRVLVPAIGLWLVIVGVGLLITGPLDNLPREAEVNRWFESIRTPTLNSVTAVLSAIGTTEFIIGACLLFVALFWWRTKQWWLAVVPPQAIAVQAIVFMTAWPTVSGAVDSIRRFGGIDYLEKPIDEERLLASVSEGVQWSCRRRAQLRRTARLTPREREVFALLVKGLSSKAIAAELELSPKTVEDHRAQISAKTGTSGLAQLIELAGA